MVTSSTELEWFGLELIPVNEIELH